MPQESDNPSVITGPLDLIATATFGLEAVVAHELRQLGYAPRITQSGRVHFSGSERDICRANLWLRSADRVLVCVDQFDAPDFGVLFDRTRAIAWENWLPANATFPVTGRSIKSQLSSVPACQKIVKKAIVERLKAAYSLDWCDETGPLYSIEIALLNNLATLVIDTSGAGLHKRGYRPLVGGAPLKETLAAALIQLSVWRAGRPLIDPFCGSGTIPIEAALIARNMAPGLQRSFAAENWNRISADLWTAVREEARAAIKPRCEEPIIGTDEDESALRLARLHAEKAGVAEDIHFQQKSFIDLTSKRSHGCVICNPPYGERLGSTESLTPLYRAMPEVFRRLKTWSFYVLTAVPDFEQLVGQPATRRRKLYNARIECTYFQFLGPKPGRDKTRPVADAASEMAIMVETRSVEPVESTSAPLVETSLESLTTATNHASAEDSGVAANIATTIPSTTEATAELTAEPTAAPTSAPVERPHRAPIKQVFGGLSDKANRQADDFRARLTTLARHLRRWPTKQGITCFRLYERDIPEVPLVVDRYEDSLHIAEFERPTDHTPAEHADWLDLMLRTAGETLDVPRQNIYLKQRRRQRGDDQYERVDYEQHRKIVNEGGLKFEVNLSDFLDTGLFLDHRITRSMVRQAAEGKRFLNLFSYTGSFSVYAAAGGAVETVSVDLSANYLDWAQRNVALNGLADSRHSFIRSDAMQFVVERGRHARFDLAVVDVPTFSNSKRLEDDWDVQWNHVELLTRLIEMMTPSGVIYFSTNYRRFKLDEPALAGVAIREISRQTVPPDFRNRRIHRCWRIVKN